MEALKYIPFAALLLVISGLMLGAGSLSLSKFSGVMDQCTNSSHIYNSTVEFCHVSGGWSLASDGNYSAATPERLALEDSQDGVLEIATQVPTIAIVVVMTLIITLLVGIFGYLRFFRE